MVESPVSNLLAASIATPVLGVWLRLKILKLFQNYYFKKFKVYSYLLAGLSIIIFEHSLCDPLSTLRKERLCFQR